MSGKKRDDLRVRRARVYVFVRVCGCVSQLVSSRPRVSRLEQHAHALTSCLHPLRRLQNEWLSSTFYLLAAPISFSLNSPIRQ